MPKIVTGSDALRRHLLVRKRKLKVSRYSMAQRISIREGKTAQSVDRRLKAMFEGRRMDVDLVVQVARLLGLVLEVRERES